MQEGTHLSWDVVVKVTCILRVVQLWVVRSGVFVNILPVDTPKPRVHLVARRSAELFLSLSVRAHLDDISPVDALRVS